MSEHSPTYAASTAPASLAGTPEQTEAPSPKAVRALENGFTALILTTRRDLEAGSLPRLNIFGTSEMLYLVSREELQRFAERAGSATPASSDVLTGRYVVRQQGREWRLIDTAIPASPDAPVAWFINSGEAKVFADWLASLPAPVPPSSSIAVPTTAQDDERCGGGWHYFDKRCSFCECGALACPDDLDFPTTGERALPSGMPR